jgi:hypothetical protein
MASATLAPNMAAIQQENIAGHSSATGHPEWMIEIGEYDAAQERGGAFPT